ncbi:hypothetical protein QFZ49_003727 [Streptomyces turgidiscabies]|uniref:Uncharacterized protein n=1 Tax=Streptomyces turgidiscabies TaxID=85558 RepID=A0ABU0RP71_9ACTN|nr:hypothetical protein [Streptomyces turgidiscabies]
MIRRLLAALGIDHTTYYCANCGGHFPAGHFPCN